MRNESLDSGINDNLNDFLFEAYIGTLYEKQGYKVYITPRSGDKGIDVIAMKGSGNYAIQCKHSKNNVGQECMSEVLSGAKYYEAKYNTSFIPMAWTNSHYTPTALDFAKTIGVKCNERKDLIRWINSDSITMEEVYRLDNIRK